MDADVDADVTVEIRRRDAEVAQPLGHRIAGMVCNQQKRARAPQALFADRLRVLRAQQLLCNVQVMPPGLTSLGAERIFSLRCCFRAYRNSVDMAILLC